MMAKSISCQCICFFLSVVFIFVNLISCHNNKIELHHENHVALFIFGDSLLDNGNNNYISTILDFRANFWPYGETFFNYPTGRFSDGRLIPDFIAQFAGLPLIPPYLKPGNPEFRNGVNFASAGAGALLETHQGLVVDLGTQIKYFKKVETSLRHELGVAKAKNLLSKAVYLIGIGGNDYLTKNSTVVSNEEFVSMVIGNLTLAVKEIYKKGGRKFGFMEMMPLGCLPYIKAQNGGCCINGITQLAELHNSGFPKALNELKEKLNGFKYAHYNFFESVSERLNNPSKYGFKDATACCGYGEGRGVYSCGGKRGVTEFILCENPDDYLFFDAYHFSEKAYQQFAKLMWSGTIDIVWPYNFKTLFQANDQMF
ncbi:GDSL esterase/lipase 2 isoform X1 [Gossypium raimondii]|nr:GDSL esterase/lipase 2 isoform X1 [Gossypium raimondii]